MAEEFLKKSEELLKEAYLLAILSKSNEVDDYVLRTSALNLLKAIDNIYMGTGEQQIKLFHDAEKSGIHILRPHFYSPIPTVYNLDDKIWTRNEVVGIDWNIKEGVSLLHVLSTYGQEFKELVDKKEFDPLDGQFRYHDAAVYYSMIRHYKPKHIVEVGAGSTTKLASLAIKKHPETLLLSIDPFPPSYVSEISELTKLIKKPVQDVPIEEFEKLKENDFLFIDSSHVSKIGSDVNYLFLEVLPRLQKGVIIHIHDIFLPLEMPKEWILQNLFWNEQYILHAFLIGNSDYKVLFGNKYMSIYHPDVLLKIFNNEPIGGGSFWFKKIK